MTSILKADTIQDTDGNNIINESGNTITIGASGDTISIPSGATIANSGTATGFNQITMIDQFRLSASIAGANHVIDANWERPDTGISAQFGSIQMSQSSGIFTFPSTGFYKVDFIAGLSYGNVADNQTNIFTQFTENNSSYANYAVAFAGSNSSSNNSRFTVSSSIIVDITDTSNQKVRFEGTSFQSSNVVIEGDTGYNVTTATFTRIGDT